MPLVKLTPAGVRVQRVCIAAATNTCYRLDRASWGDGVGVVGWGGVVGGGVLLIIADKEQMRGKSHRQTTCGHIVK